METPEYLLETQPSPKYVPSARLFGEMCDFYDFEMENYRTFLSTIETVEDLIEGLQEIRPFADDALLVAEKMTASDLRRFKKSLENEHCLALSEECEGKSTMPRRFYPLLFPSQFILAFMIAEVAEAPLGCVLVRFMNQKMPNW